MSTMSLNDKLSSKEGKGSRKMEGTAVFQMTGDDGKEPGRPTVNNE